MRQRAYLFQIAMVLTGVVSNAQETPPFPPPPDPVSATTIIATSQEPGERLFIRGTIYHADGITPYRDLIVYLYQTDASGVYNHGSGSWREPRLHGWIRTNDRGEYSIRTIKPGSYPRSRNPAHIHAIIRLPGDAPKWIDDFLFEGDPFLTDQQREGSRKNTAFANIIKLTRDETGMLAGVRDIRIDN